MRKTIIFFGLLGPIIGSFVFVGTNALQIAEFQNLSILEIGGKLGFGIFASLFYGILGIPLAMLFGFVPGSISGYFYWLVSRNLKMSNPVAIKRFLIGSITSLITTTILFVLFYAYNFYYHGTNESFSWWWFFAWPGCIAGGVCGILVKSNNPQRSKGRSASLRAPLARRYVQYVASCDLLHWSVFLRHDNDCRNFAVPTKNQ